ncbi:glycoside hydrolase family 31 protein [Isachenkonia alkalipeptolytica]|uniref:glycoside hydrolase family 31 protein n=1 Tax=Isachenkonia alkalipeptolytica TaxID=2565777 RepID=UPI00136A58FD
MKSLRHKNGVEEFVFGTPVSTGAVVEKGRAENIEFRENITLGEPTLLTFDLEPEDRIYGLGEHLGSINRRGRRFRSYCRDEANHTEDKNELYGAHNFFIHVKDHQQIGYFIDFPGEVVYDTGFQEEEVFSIEIYGKNFRILKIFGDTPEKIVTGFLQAIGKAYIPPKWAFGYFQSRWGYKDQKEIEEVYHRFKKEDLPLEGIYLDLDYMEDFKNFTVSKERFPDFKEFVGKLKKEGVYLIPIIDAGVKIEAGYDTYEEGIKGKHFCLDGEENPYVAAVWPGKVHFPDFLQSKTRSWFGDQYRFLTDLGIEGVWNDMNEPAIFYDEKNLEEAVDLASECRGKNLNVHQFFQLKDTFANLLNNEDYHQRFYHRMEAKKHLHRDVHNLYGDYMTRAANEGLGKHLKRRFLLISRASSIGMHRYGGIWTGDNASWWTHLEENIRMMPSINMCGFYYIGADTGGFGGQCSGELLTRWFQFSAFAPLFRNHSALDTRPQEPYAFSKEVLEHSRSLLKCRYRLIPYLYSTYMKAVENYQLFFKPMAFQYPKEYEAVEDQLLIGEELMLAPIHKKNQSHRLVDLPEKMALVTLREEEADLTLAPAGPQRLSYDLDHLRFFLRPNQMIPLGEGKNNVSKLSLEKLEVLAYIREGGAHVFYDDDGISMGEKNQERMHITITPRENSYDIAVKKPHGALKSIDFKIINHRGEIQRIHYKIKE